MALLRNPFCFTYKKACASASAGLVAPFVGSDLAVIDEVMRHVLQRAAATAVSPKGEGKLSCVDIGCGDGRIAIAAATMGMQGLSLVA